MPEISKEKLVMSGMSKLELLEEIEVKDAKPGQSKIEAAWYKFQIMWTVNQAHHFGEFKTVV